MYFILFYLLVTEAITSLPTQFWSQIFTLYLKRFLVSSAVYHICYLSPQQTSIYLIFSSKVNWRSGRLCPDCPQHSSQDSSGKSAHHSRSFPLWGSVCPFCSCQLWQSYRSGHQRASSYQPDRSVQLSIFIFSIAEIFTKCQYYNITLNI